MINFGEMSRLKKTVYSLYMSKSKEATSTHMWVLDNDEGEDYEGSKIANLAQKAIHKIQKQAIVNRGLTGLAADARRDRSRRNPSSVGHSTPGRILPNHMTNKLRVVRLQKCMPSSRTFPFLFLLVKF